jgi:predicted nucleotidyltransferase
MVSSDILTQVKLTLSKYLVDSQYKVFIFGSRVSNTHRRFSDLDIGILGATKVPSSLLIKIQDDLRDSDIPYLTDVIDFSSVPDRFKNKALSNIISL